MPKDVNGNAVVVGDQVSVNGTVESISDTDAGRNISIRLEDGDVISMNSAQTVIVADQPEPAPAPETPAKVS